MSFEYILKNKERFLSNPDYCLSPEGSREFICRICDFYKESEDELECGAYKLLRLLMLKKVITVEEIIHALEDRDPLS